MGFKFLNHTADIKIQVNEKNLSLAFVSSALALKEVIAEDTDVKPIIKKQIVISGLDLKSLLYNFLEEFLFLLDSQGFLLSKIVDFKLEEKKKKISCTLLGDNAKGYRVSNNVKAITYSEMKISSKKDKASMEFVLDV
jgi:SHS2 domain-containing protein